MGKLAKEYWLEQRWGKLRVSPDQSLPEQWAKTSHKRFQIICHCAPDRQRIITPIFSNVGTGLQVSCGRCNWKPKSHWLAQTWGSLSLMDTPDLPEEWGESSSLSVRVKCACEKATEKVLKFSDIHKAGTRSCGLCNHFPKEYWLAQTFGKLQLLDRPELPPSWGRGSKSQMLFRCQCTNEVRVAFERVVSGHNQSCGGCLDQPRAFWLEQRWGKVWLDPEQDLPAAWGKGSNRKVVIICECGNDKKRVSFYSLIVGKIRSCGDCSHKSREDWKAQQPWGKLRLAEDQNLPESWAPTSHQKFEFICECGRRTSTQFSCVFIGKTKSCGCLQIGENEFSPESIIRDYIASLAPDTCTGSYSIEGSGKSYDVYVPSKRLAIEHHGLIWHSEKFRKPPLADYHKFLLATQSGDRLIQIYGDEWLEKSEIMKAQFREILSPSHKKRIQPQFEVALGKTPPPARAFLDRHHYLGAAGGCLTVMARHRDEIVGVWVFMKRETGVVLWHRACWDHRYKAWNPHEKALHLALPQLKDMGFHKILTFADNRFHTGGLYEKLGFKFEKEIPPDYYYTNGVRRVSKYALRVKAGVDEKANAAAQGWYRIWDSGKKRYCFSII